jgi:hypothetical protein
MDNVPSVVSCGAHRQRLALLRSEHAKVGLLHKAYQAQPQLHDVLAPSLCLLGCIISIGIYGITALKESLEFTENIAKSKNLEFDRNGLPVKCMEGAVRIAIRSSRIISPTPFPSVTGLSIRITF